MSNCLTQASCCAFGRNCFRIAATAASSPGLASHSAVTMSSSRSELTGIVFLRLLGRVHQRVDATDRVTSAASESSTVLELSGRIKKDPARTLAGRNDNRLRQFG